MSKLITASINLNKVDKTKIFVSEKTGDKYLNISIWLNDAPDNYGNDCSIQQSTKKGEDKIFLGNGKYFTKQEARQPMLPNDPDLNQPDDLGF